jgi:hypothetical protein
VDLVKQIYQDVEIVYNENTNKWVFELGGKEKLAISLREAKQAIDDAPKQKRAVVRFPALLLDWQGDKLDEVIVGAGSKGYRGQIQFWVSNNGSRSKEDAARLIKLNNVNAPLIEEVRTINNQIQELKQQRAKKVAAMERVDVPAESD